MINYVPKAHVNAVIIRLEDSFLKLHFLYISLLSYEIFWRFIIVSESNCSISITTFKQWHAYIHNWSLQPFSQDYNLASHTIYVLKSTPNFKYFSNSSWQFYFTLKVFARNQLRGNHQRIIFHIFVSAWDRFEAYTVPFRP